MHTTTDHNLVITLAPAVLAALTACIIAGLGGVAAIVRFLWRLDITVQGTAKAFASLEGVVAAGIANIRDDQRKDRDRIDALWKSFAEYAAGR